MTCRVVRFQNLQRRVFCDVVEIAVVMQEGQVVLDEHHQTRASRHSDRLPSRVMVPLNSNRRRFCLCDPHACRKAFRGED